MREGAAWVNGAAAALTAWATNTHHKTDKLLLLCDGVWPANRYTHPSGQCSNCGELVFDTTPGENNDGAQSWLRNELVSIHAYNKQIYASYHRQSGPTTRG